MPNTSHTVKPGELLSTIAKKNNVTVADILAANPDITNPNLIQVGQVIQIPTPAGDPDVAANNTPAISPAAPASASAASGSAANAILDQFQSLGASAKTAKQDKLPGGVPSSEKM